MERKKLYLTGIQPTGEIHLGNYFGAIKPVLELIKNSNNPILFFIADVHALNHVKDKKVLKENVYKALATYIACGLDPERVVIYKQSDISEIFELQSYLNNFIPKTMMNNSHAYQTKLEQYKNDESNINMGLFNYPILMAADILLFKADIVPVGPDQIQHIELARDIARRSNFEMNLKLKEPEELIVCQESIIGLDGRKMSKSYSNTIPLFCDEKKLEKLIKSIKTDSLDKDAPKPLDNNIYKIYELFSTKQELDSMKEEFKKGMSYGIAKEKLFKKINDSISPLRNEYNNLIMDKKLLDSILEKGKNKAKPFAQRNLNDIKKRLGLI